MLNDSPGLAHTAIRRVRGRAPSLSREGQQFLKAVKVFNPKGFFATAVPFLGNLGYTENRML